MPRFVGTIETAHGSLRLGERTLIMGILNVTPDSFSDGGRYVTPDAAVERGLQLATDGADILDIGGESTRPGSEPVPPDEQCRRVVPAIRQLRSSGRSIPISIDTRSAEVAAAALDAGADIVNDVSAMRDDSAMVGLVAARRAPVVLMHMQGTPRTMQIDPRYADVVGEIIREMRGWLAAHEKLAAPILLDPGIGFGKTSAHNWEILRRIAEFHELGRPLIVGTSRKRFLRDRIGSDDPANTLFGTAATVAACCLAGVQIVRVHDAAEMRSVVEACAAIARD